MWLGALPRKILAKAAMRLELDPQDPSSFKYNQLRKYILDKCLTADPLAFLDSEVTLMALGVSPYSVPAGVPLPQMPVVIDLPAIPSEKTPAPAQPMEEIAIAKANNTINTKRDKMMKAFEDWHCQLSKANEPDIETSRLPWHKPSKLTIHVRIHQ